MMRYEILWAMHTEAGADGKTLLLIQHHGGEAEHPMEEEHGHRSQELRVGGALSLNLLVAKVTCINSTTLETGRQVV